MYSFSKKQGLIIAGILSFLVLVGCTTAVAITQYPSILNEYNSHSKIGKYTSYSALGQSPISRMVTNTASGVDISIGASDTGSLSMLHAEFQLIKGSAEHQNSAFKAELVEGSGGVRISVTSINPDIIKMIQSKAASGESGVFGVELLENESAMGYSKEH